MINWRAFSANSGQFDAGSTTTGSIFMPITPPLALISSNAISATSFSTVSEIAIVPESECNTPTLTVFCCANAPCDEMPAAISAALTATALTIPLRFNMRSPVDCDKTPTAGAFETTASQDLCQIASR